MSSKFHKQQQKARYAGSGTRFTPNFTERIDALCSESSSAVEVKAVAEELQQFASLQNAYSELEALKKIGNMVASLPHTPTPKPSSFHQAASLLVEVLFQANSKPLHRQLVAWCRQLPEAKLVMVGHTLVAIIEDAVTRSVQPGSTVVHIAEPLLSLLDAQPLHPFLRTCAPTAVSALSQGVLTIVQKAASGAHIPPSVMHSAQDAIAAIYAFLQQHGLFMAKAGAPGQHAICTVSQAMIASLQGAALAREAMASAAVCLYAAASLPCIEPSAMALQVARGLFVGPHTECITEAASVPSSTRRQAPGRSIVMHHLAQHNSSLASEMQKFSFYGHICAMKGLLQALPPSVLTVPLSTPVGSDTAPLGSGTAPLSSDSATEPTVAAVNTTSGSAQQPQEAMKTPNAVNPADAHSAPQIHLTAQITPSNASQSGNSLAAPLQHLQSAQGSSHMQAPAQDGTPEQCSHKTQHLDTCRSAPARRWSLLSDAALPACCQAVVASTDAHHKFHSVSALALCLERIKQCLQDHLAAHSDPPPQNHDQPADSAHHASQTVPGSITVSPAGLPPDVEAAGASTQDQGAADTSTSKALPLLSNASRDNVLQLIWANFEDSLTQTVRQVQAAFESLLDILELQSQLQHTHASRGSCNSQPSVSATELLKATALQLLAVGSHRKGRYLPLAALVQRLGAQQMLQLQPDLMKQILLGMQDDAVGSAAASLLHHLLRQLMSDLIKQKGSQAEGLQAWRQHWIPVLLDALRHPEEHLRHRVSLYAVPVPLALDSASVLPLLQQVLEPQPCERTAPDSQVATLIAILKTARALGLYQDLEQVSIPGEGSIAIPEAMLQRAVGHASQTLQLDALQLACVHPRATNLPGKVELAMVRQALVLGLRCTSSSMRNKWAGLLAKLLRRIFMSVHSVLSRKRAARSADAQAQEQMAGVERQQDFMQWLTQTLLASLYPGAPYERKYLAVLLLDTLLEVWNSPDAGCKSYIRLEGRQQALPASNAGLLLVGQHRFKAFCDGFFEAKTSKLLLGASVDSWDRMREGAIACLLRLPTPLPGLGSPEDLLPQPQWAARLLRSPRVRESDAGSRLLCLLYEKYTLNLHWQLELFPDCKAKVPQATQQSNPLAASIPLLHSLILWLQRDIEAGQADLAQACRHSLAHGVLLALRYLTPLVPWQLAAACGEQLVGTQAFLKGLLKLVHQATELALPFLANPQDSNIGAEDVEADDLDVEELQGGMGPDGDALAPTAQVIITGCWLTMKEVSLLLGALAKCTCVPEVDAVSDGQRLLCASDLADMGQLFLHVLTTMKHNGAVDKTQAGFTALARRLLLEPSTELNKLPQQWLQRMIAHIQRPNQSRDDIVRRSAGIPCAFVALFAAEPSGNPKTLLHLGMNVLLTMGGDESGGQPWPRVHALNSLRLAFSEKTLANDASGFFAQGMQAAVLAMGAQAWEVRNAASLLFTALVLRMLGFRNMSKGESARRAITGAEFFNRYPTLHPFLLAQLQAASQQLSQGSSAVHPSLVPILALLSRLRPSLHNQSTAASSATSPAKFLAAVQQCASASQWAVRCLAARSLAPLVPPEDLVHVLQQLLTHACAGIPGNLNAAHGCLLQARTLLELNGHTVSSHKLFRAIVPALHKCLPLMHPNSPCAPIRNEATLLAAAALGLPDLAMTEHVRTYTNETSSLCWLAIAPSSSVNSGKTRVNISNVDTKGHPHMDQHSRQHAAGVHSNESSAPAYSSSSSGTHHHASPAAPAGSDISRLIPSSLQSSSAAAARVNARSSKQETPGTGSQACKSRAQVTGCDDADPVTCLWLKNATLLYFGPSSARARSCASKSDRSEGLIADVQEALASSNYDVRSACLKALILRAVQGEVLPHDLPALLQQKLAHETHHKVLRRMLQLLTLTSVSKPTAEAASAQRPSQSMGRAVHAMGGSATAEDAETSHPLATTAEADQTGSQASACHRSTADDQASSSTASQDATADVSELQCDGGLQAAQRVSCAYQADQSLALHALARYQQIYAPVISSFQPGVRQAGLHALGAALRPVLSALLSRACSPPPQHQDHRQHQQHTSQQQEHPQQLEQQSSESRLEGQLSDAVTGFRQFVQDSSEAQQSDAIRLSAVKALEVSGLLESQAGADGWQEGSPLTAPALQAWLLVIQLMEDEDDEVRSAAACAAGPALHALQPQGTSSAAGHVELVERRAFQMLGRCCLHLPAVLSQMLSWVYRSDRKTLLQQQIVDNMPGPAAKHEALPIAQTPDVQSAKASQAANSNFAHLRLEAETAHTADDSHAASSASVPSRLGKPEGSEAARPAPCGDDQQAEVPHITTSQVESAQTDGDKVSSRSARDSTHWQPGLVRKLFDKELDNHHEEALLLAQLAAQQLRLVLQQDSCPAQHIEDVCSWTVIAAEDLLSLSRHVLHMHQQQQVTWLGGIANHEDVFQPLYRMLLAVHTAASCQAVLIRVPTLAETLQSASACLQQVDLNPVLSALLVQTTAMWTAEKTDNDMQEQEEPADAVDAWSITFLAG